MEFATVGTYVRAQHKEHKHVLYRGIVRACFPIGAAKYAITLETIYDSVVTVTNVEFDVTRG